MSQNKNYYMLFCKKIVCVYIYYVVNLRTNELYEVIPELIMITLSLRHCVNHDRPSQQQNTQLFSQGTELIMVSCLNNTQLSSQCTNPLILGAVAQHGNTPLLLIQVSRHAFVYWLRHVANVSSHYSLLTFH